MKIKNTIHEILNENFKSMIGEAGEKQNRPKSEIRKEDMLRKRKERRKKSENRNSGFSSNKPNKPIKNIKETDIPSRKNLEGELRLTPREAFASRLIAYLESDKSYHMLEAIKLLEEYPKLRLFVKEQSNKKLPNYHFNVYSVRERMNEEIGGKGKRTKGNHHNWYMSKYKAKDISDTDDGYLMETSVEPENVLIYVPAFTKLMEKCIIEGLVDEPKVNILRKAKTTDEIILPDKYNSGLIVEVW